MTEGGVKLQWSKTAKKTAVVQVQEAAEADRRESVRGISGRGLVLEHEKVVEVKKQLVIPKVPDTFEVRVNNVLFLKRLVLSYLPFCHSGHCGKVCLKK